MDQLVTTHLPLEDIEADSRLGYLHSVESGAAVDGPGMRFVYFMSGCYFRCLYCHNPDTWKLHGGKRITLQGALEQIRPYAKFLKSVGGVTISGGEPLVQAPFVGNLFRHLKADFHLHTALDTQGFLHSHVADSWFDPIDLVLLDIKHSDPAKYHAITAQHLQPTLDFAQRLKRLNKKTWIRYVLVPGLSDEADDIKRLAEFVAGLGNIIERVEVLPFHKMGEFKWKQLGMEYQLANTPTPSFELIEGAREIFKAYGLVAM